MPLMIQDFRPKTFLILSGIFLALQGRGQELDSLLHNKRVYVSENVQDLPAARIDGVLDDEIWSRGQWHGHFTQQQPVGGAPGTERTYIKVLYDHSNLFVAIACQDAEPEKIRDVFDRRDAFTGDMTGIALDSYFDKRTAFEFNLSAAGQKTDLKHLGDFQWDLNWNGVWDGATARNDTGWVAEMKIPFSQIRYDNIQEHTWGMHVWRWIERKAEEDQWQYIPREAPAMVYLFGELKGIDGIRTSRQVELLPYLLTSLNNPEGKSGFDPLQFNGGIDAKVGISSDYTLDLSINPDFGQVEADPSVLNLTSFETFYEEKRPFFLEGNEIFDFELEGDIPYYSRRIGSAPSLNGPDGGLTLSGLPGFTTILGAAKLTGRSSKGLSLGVVSGITAEERATATGPTGTESQVQVAPLTNYLASRIKREFNDGNTIIGGMYNMVNRISPEQFVSDQLPSHSISGALDLLHYWDNRNYYVSAKSIASQIRGSNDAMLVLQNSHIHRFQRPDAGYLEVDTMMERMNGHGGLVEVGKKGGRINFHVLGQYRSPGLDLNDMGYIRQADYLGEETEISYRMNEPGKRIRNYTVSVDQEARWSFGGENTRNEWGSEFTMMTNRLWRFQLSYDYETGHLDTRELRGGPALRMDGEHNGEVFISSNQSKNLTGNVGLSLGDHSVKGSHSETVHAQLGWLPVRKLRLSVAGGYEQRNYHQQYVSTLAQGGDPLYLVGSIAQQTLSVTFRAELFLSPELSLQYYGSPYWSVGDYEHFKRVSDPGNRDPETRLEEILPDYDGTNALYAFNYQGSTWEFSDPDFSFMQFRSNLVFRWEYKLGSTLYVVWAHDRSDWENLYQPVTDITGDLIGVSGNNIFMLKLNYWFSL